MHLHAISDTDTPPPVFMHEAPRPDSAVDDVLAALAATSPDAAPLVGTTRGNLPAALLQYRYGWLDSDAETTFIEEHWLGDELVKRSVHTMLKQGLASAAEAARLD